MLSLVYPDYTRPLITDPEGTLRLPTSPDQGYTYELQLSADVLKVNFTVYVSSNYDTVETEDESGVLKQILIRLRYYKNLMRNDDINMGTPTEFYLKFPETYHGNKSLLILLENPSSISLEEVNTTLRFMSEYIVPPTTYLDDVSTESGFYKVCYF